MNLFKRLFRRPVIDGDVREEIETHIAMRAELNCDAGMPEEEANLAAKRQFGNTTSVREQIYQMNGFGFLDAIFADVRSGVRSLRKTPGFTVMAIVILAVCVGTAGAMFSFVDAVFFKPLPYSDPDRLVRVQERRPSGELNRVAAPLNFIDWENQNTVFEKMAARTFVRETLSGIGEPVVVLGTRATASYFGVFGITPAFGRLFLPEEEQPGKDNVVVLSHRLWSEQFGNDPNIIGHSIVLGDRPYIVVGVLPKGNALERDLAQYWRPLAYAGEERTRGFHFLFVTARLKPDVTLQQARAEMNVLADRIAADHPDSNKGLGVAVEPYADVMITASHLHEALYLWSAAAATLLLIGLANLVNLMLARATARNREVAIRMALGAGRRRLIGQLLTESLLVSITGGLLGLGLTYTIVRMFRTALPDNTLPREANVVIDLRVIVFMFVLSVVTGVIVGTALAFRATAGDLMRKISRSGRTSTQDFSRHRLGTALVIGQVGLSLAMLIISGLLVRGFLELMHVNAGFDEARMLTMWLTIPQKQFSNPASVAAYVDEILQRLDRLPGVQNAAAAAAPPLDGWGYGMAVQISGAPKVDVPSRPIVGFKNVSPSYFDTVNLELLRGRPFSKLDTHDSPLVAVISATMAKRFFNDKDPIGQHLLIPELVPGQLGAGRDISWEIVGVVADERVSLFDPVSPGLYVPIQQSLPIYFNIVVQTNTPAATLKPSVRKVIHEINGDQAIYGLLTVSESKRLTTTTNRQQTFLLVAFTMAAMLLSAIGIYALISFLITQQTGEIGIRMALGSTPALIVKLVLTRVMSWTAAGAILGVVAAFALIHALHSLLFGISEFDSRLFFLATALLVLTSAVAAWLPARRASRTDPMVALRAD